MKIVPSVTTATLILVAVTAQAQSNCRYIGNQRICNDVYGISSTTQAYAKLANPYAKGIPESDVVGGLGLADLPTSNWNAGWRSGVTGLQSGYGRIGQAFLGLDLKDFIRRKKAEEAFYARNAPGQ